MFSKRLTESLIKIVYDYTNRGIYLDDPAIVKIIGLFNATFGLNEYIRNLEYVDTKCGETRNAYLTDSKKVLFNYNRSLCNSINAISNDKNYDSHYEKILEINLSMLSKIIHEICYAYYFKGCFEGRKYLEQVLYRASFEEKMLELMPISKDEKCRAYTFVSNFLYNNNINFYSMTPSNRMANVTAATYRLLVSKDKVFKPCKLVKDYEASKLLRTQLKDYDFDNIINSPTLSYFFNKATIMAGVNFKTPLYDIETVQCTLEDESERLPLGDKLYYGLELTEKEQKFLSKKLR